MVATTKQVRVLVKTHRALRKLSKTSGVPVTKIVDRLVQREIGAASKTAVELANPGDPVPGPLSRQPV